MSDRSETRHQRIGSERANCLGQVPRRSDASALKSFREIAKGPGPSCRYKP
jgi:hypothetical protein